MSPNYFRFCRNSRKPSLLDVHSRFTPNTKPLPPNAVNFWTSDQDAYLAQLAAQRVSWVARTTLFQEMFGLNRKTQSLKDRFLQLRLSPRSQIELEWTPTEETFLRSSISSQLDIFHRFDIDEICRSFWAKFGQSRSQTSITMKIKKQRQELLRLKKHWSEAEDDFLRNWSCSRPDATAALNAKFGTQRSTRSVVFRVFELEKEESVRQGRASEPEAGSDGAGDAACEDAMNTGGDCMNVRLG
ncbi:hypothetical protein F4782DRAFT_252544 [Xylaria castorea]|nr:hypothetical protein F4782DRAFT_252544 [Xylaria castorea]